MSKGPFLKINTIEGKKTSNKFGTYKSDNRFKMGMYIGLVHRIYTLEDWLEIFEKAENLNSTHPKCFSCRTANDDFKAIPGCKICSIVTPKKNKLNHACIPCPLKTFQRDRKITMEDQYVHE
jgi:hypothetical protein